MRDDRHEWDRRYREDLARLTGPPTTVLTAWLPFLPRGRALDLAAGPGRHTVLLAHEGYRVDALDISLVALARLVVRADREGVRVRAAAIDLDDLIVPPNTYDLIVDTYYVNRRLFAQLPAALRPGGALVVEAALRDPAFDSPEKLRTRLEPGELARVCAGLDVAYYAERAAERPCRARGVCQVVAFRPLCARADDRRPSGGSCRARRDRLSNPI